MQQINIEAKEGNLLSIKAPWNPLFIEELKKLHGKWDPDEKVWTVNDFAQEQLNVAMDLCQYFEHKKLKGYADFFNSSSSFCCGVI